MNNFWMVFDSYKIIAKLQFTTEKRCKLFLEEFGFSGCAIDAFEYVLVGDSNNMPPSTDTNYSCIIQINKSMSDCNHNQVLHTFGVSDLSKTKAALKILGFLHNDFHIVFIVEGNLE